MVDPVNQLHAMRSDSVGLESSLGPTLYSHGLSANPDMSASLPTVHISVSFSGIHFGAVLTPFEARVYAAMLQAAADKSEGGDYNPMSYVDVSWGSAL